MFVCYLLLEPNAGQKIRKSAVFLFYFHSFHLKLIHRSKGADGIKHQPVRDTILLQLQMVRQKKRKIVFLFFSQIIYQKKEDK